MEGSPPPKETEPGTNAQEEAKPAASESPATPENSPEPVMEAAPEPAAEGGKKRRFHLRMLEKGVDAAGFGGVWKAWESPDNRFRNVMKSIGTKAADMLAGRIVGGTFKLVALTWVAGMIGGVSTVGAVALLALAAGASSAVYSYHKDYFHDRFFGPKEKRAEVKYITRARIKNGGMAFLGGTASGVFGAYLAKTGMLQHLFARVKDFFSEGGHIITQGAKMVTSDITPQSPVFKDMSLKQHFAAAIKPQHANATVRPVLVLKPQPA